MKNNRLIVEFMRVSLLAASYFILNFEDMVNTNGVYLYEFKTNVKGEDIIISATYRPKSEFCSCSFFHLRQRDVIRILTLNIEGVLK